jgi:hypothetical protein
MNIKTFRSYPEATEQSPMDSEDDDIQGTPFKPAAVFCPSPVCCRYLDKKLVASNNHHVVTSTNSHVDSTDYVMRQESRVAC